MRFWRPFADLNRLFSASIEYERLFELSDRELSTLGLTRDDLVRGFLAEIRSDRSEKGSPQCGESVSVSGREET